MKRSQCLARAVILSGIAAIAIFTTSLRAQSPAWNPAGPWAGDVTAFGQVDDALLASTSTSGMFRSTDNGYTWRHLHDPPEGNYATGFAAHKSAIIKFGGLYAFRSRDHGDTWEQLGTLEPVSVAFAGDSLVGITADGAVAVFSEQTGTWHPRDTVDGGRANVMVSHGQDLYVGTDNGVLHSTNAGNTWQHLAGATFAYSIRAISVTDNSIVIAGHTTPTTTRDYIYRSTDNGANWTPMIDGMPNASIAALAIIPGSILVAVNDYGILLWRDTSSTWLQVTGSGHRFTSFATIGNTVLAGYGLSGNEGIIRSVDGGSTWTHTGAGFSTLDILSIVKHGNTILATDQAYSLHRSTDNGATWTLQSLSPDTIGAATQTRIMAPCGNKVLMATDYEVSTVEGIHSSADDGATWTRVTSIAAPIKEIAVSGATAIVLADKFYRSNDTGNTWDNEAFPPNASSIDHILFHGADLFAFAGGDVYRSADSGATWELAGTAGRPHLAAVCSSEGAIIAGEGRIDDAGTILRSTDRGATWNVPDAGTIPVTSISALAVVGNGIVAATQSGEMYKSEDDGAHWIPWGLTPDGAGNITTMVASASDLYAGTTYGGIFRSLALSAVPRQATAGDDLGDLAIFPDPTTGTATLHYTLDRPCRVTIDMFDALGRRVASIPASEQQSGAHAVPVDMAGHPAGNYVCRIMMGGRPAAVRFVVVR